MPADRHDEPIDHTGQPNPDRTAQPRPPSGPPAGAPSGSEGAAPGWRVQPALPVVKIGAAVLLVALGALLAANDNDPVQLGIAVVAAAGLLVWGVRDLVAPVRLSADPAGITVISGYAGRRQLPWTAVERIRVDTRPRLGLRTETLEVDAGESLHLFSRYDLGTAPTEVAETLHRLQATHSTGVTGHPPR